LEGEAGGALAPLDFENIIKKKIVFLVLSEKKQIPPLLAPPGKIMEKSLGSPLEIILPTPM